MNGILSNNFVLVVEPKYCVPYLQYFRDVTLLCKIFILWIKNHFGAMFWRPNWGILYNWDVMLIVSRDFCRNLKTLYFRSQMSCEPPAKVIKMSARISDDSPLTIPTTKTIDELKENGIVTLSPIIFLASKLKCFIRDGNFLSNSVRL